MRGNRSVQPRLTIHALNNPERGLIVLEQVISAGASLHNLTVTDKVIIEVHKLKATLSAKRPDLLSYDQRVTREDSS